MALSTWTLIVFICKTVSAIQDFAVDVNSDGSYNVVVQGNVWLKSAPTFFRADSKLYTTADGSLKLIKNYQTSGQDFVGQWESNTFRYQAGSSQIEASFVTYSPDPKIVTYNNPALPFVLFKQRYINGATNTTASSSSVTISGFPGFLVEESSLPLGFLSIGGYQFGTLGLVAGQWGPNSFNISTGLYGGPLLLFDKVKKANTLIITPASEFMSSSISRLKDLYWGTMGRVDVVPKNFESSYILFCGNQGINKAFESWGEILRTWYGRTDYFVKADFTNNYLGRWTDNYGYDNPNCTEPGKLEQDAILDMVDNFRKQGVPIRYINYDEWWMYKDSECGIIKWDSPPNIFPDGIKWLYNKTNVPVHGYNKFWSNQVVYAKQNGGTYDFLIDGKIALPLEERFWTDIISEGRQWGLIAMEHDFLSTSMEEFMPLQTDVHLGKMWLKQMGNGAAKNGIPIQYCMTLPRHALQILEIPAVTQARVSDDYEPGDGNDHWKIGISSLFALALGVAPFKDNFWTSKVETSKTFNRTESNTELLGAIASLSTGPIGPGDNVGFLNKTLVMRSVNADGLILKPSRPATAIDNQIRRMAWSDFDGPDGEVWSTYSEFGGSSNYGIVLAVNVTGSYSITPSLVGFEWFHYSMVYPRSNLNKIQPLTDSQPLTMSGCTMSEFCIFYISPALKMNGKQILIQGELDKWVPMSPQRVTDISIGDDIIISLTGAPYEKISFWFNVDGKSSPLTCTLGVGGLATLSFNQGKCRAE